MKDKDNTLAIAAIILMVAIVILLIALTIIKGWLLLAVPLAMLMLPWIGEALKDGADF